MRAIGRAAMMSLAAALLWAGLAQGYIGIGARAGSGPDKGWIQLRGQVLCAGCTLEELRSVLPTPSGRLYQLKHQRGQVVMEVRPENASVRYRRLWLKGGDEVFETLAAEENLFKEIEVSGLLREYLPTSGTLDLTTVRVLDEG